MPNSFGWVFIVAGALLTLLGLLWLSGGAAWIGRLPGDIRIENDNSRFYFPVMTCIVISIAGTIVMWLVRMFFRP